MNPTPGTTGEPYDPSLGVAENISDAAIARSVKRLLADTARRREMRAAGLLTLDGEGAARVAADIAALVASNRATLKIAV